MDLPVQTCPFWNFGVVENYLIWRASVLFASSVLQAEIILRCIGVAIPAPPDGGRAKAYRALDRPDVAFPFYPLKISATSSDDKTRLMRAKRAHPTREQAPTVTRTHVLG